MLPSVELLVCLVIASRLLVLVVLGLAASASAQRAPTFNAYLEAETARGDTLRYGVRAGEPLILSLPGRIGGVPVEYMLDEAPALSWLVDRSFLWQTRANDRGTTAIRLRLRTQDRTDQVVVLLVEVTP